MLEESKSVSCWEAEMGKMPQELILTELVEKREQERIINVRAFYRGIKVHRKGYQLWKSLTKDKYWILLVTKHYIIERWKEYLKGILIWYFNDLCDGTLDKDE